jgi:exopolyphosphatase/pppGpp-phosphohydrolase
MQDNPLIGTVQPLHKENRRSFITTVVIVAVLLATTVGGYLVLTKRNSEPEQKVVRYGGLEIGSKGIKAIVVEAFPDPTYGIDVREVGKSETINTTLVRNLGQTKKFDEQALKETAEALKKFQERMLKEDHIPAENIYVAASSGLFAPLDAEGELKKKNKDILGAMVKEVTGKAIEFLDVQREVELSIPGSVPRDHVNESLYVDVGSGNTKGGFRTKAGLVFLELPYGSRSFRELIEKEAKKTGNPFEKQAQLLREQVLEPYLQKNHLDQKPLTDATRTRVYLSGGVVWALATFVHPEDQSQYVALSAKDIDTFQDMLLRESKDLPNPELGKIKDDKARQNAEKEIADVRNVFKLPDLKAGTEILKALSNKFDFANRKLWFARRGYLGWITAYIVEKEDKARKGPGE